MITTTTIDIGVSSITCKELTVGEIDAALSVLQPGSPMQRVYNLMEWDLPPQFVAISSGLPVDEQAALTTAELSALVAAVEQVNADFLGRISARAKHQPQGAEAESSAHGVTSGH